MDAFRFREVTVKLTHDVLLQAWGKRQRINPRRALTKRVKLTNGRCFRSAVSQHRLEGALADRASRSSGNFITEYPVPTAVKNANMSGGARESALFCLLPRRRS